MSRTERTVVVARSGPEVWAVLTDPSRVPEWQRFIVASRVEPPGPPRVGSRLHQSRSFLGRRIEFTVTATEVVSPRRISIEGEYGPARFTGGYVLDPRRGGTRLTYWIDLTLGGLFRSLSDVVAAELARQAAADLEAFRRLIEGQPPPRGRVVIASV